MLNHPPTTSPLPLVKTAISENKNSRPTPDKLVPALVNLEKTAKKETESVSYQKLLGHWQLWFITGTKKARKRSGIVLGAGRYLPSWIKISLFYSQNNEINLPDAEAGKVQNSVQIAGLHFTLSGPTKFFPKKKLLAFDFTEMQVSLLGKPIYSGYIRGGKKRSETFYQQPLKQQAFFRYFLLEENLIAARGRGGGLAIWRRNP